MLSYVTNDSTRIYIECLRSENRELFIVHYSMDLHFNPPSSKLARIILKVRYSHDGASFFVVTKFKCD